jgi:hypothetical protein
LVLLTTAAAACTPDDTFTDAGDYTCSGWSSYPTLEDLCVYGSADSYATSYTVKDFSELVCKCANNACELDACKTLTDSADQATSAKVKAAAVCSTVKDCPADATKLADGTTCYGSTWADVGADEGDDTEEDSGEDSDPATAAECTCMLDKMTFTKKDGTKVAAKEYATCEGADFKPNAKYEAEEADMVDNGKTRCEIAVAKLSCKTITAAITAQCVANYPQEEARKEDNECGIDCSCKEADCLLSWAPGKGAGLAAGATETGFAAVAVSLMLAQ